MKIIKYFLMLLVLLVTNNLLAQNPVITGQPTNQNINVGSSATFSITATGTGTLTYQWYKNSMEITGATSSTYITPVFVDDSNNEDLYYCIVTDDNGTTQSNNATLYITYMNQRVSEGLQVLYNFNEGSGTVINDQSGVGTPLNLKINNANNINWTSSGLNIFNDARIKSNGIASKLINSLTNTNEVTFEAWLLPTNLTQGGKYARIMTLSNDNKHERNIGLMQFGDQYQFHLRTSNSTLNGETVSVDSNTQKLTHYVFTRDSNSNVKVFIDGQIIYQGQLTGDFSNWNSGYFLYLGGEVNGKNYWEGTYYLTAIYSKALSVSEVGQNYNFGVNKDNFPYILKHPSSQTVQVGQSITFSVQAIGSAPINYQWKKNGINISGATNSTYTTNSLQLNDNNAEYTCLITSADGSIESNPAQVTVLVPDSRITSGIIVEYNFREGSGSVINDVSGIGEPINLTINSTDAVNWTNNGLEIVSEASIYSSSAASKIYNKCTASNEFTIETWIKPKNVNQNSARILSYAQDANARNFSLSHGSEQYGGNVRTSTTDLAGYSTLTPAGTIDGNLQHVVYVFRGDQKALIFVNGVEVVKTTVGGNFSNWTDNYRLAIANELLDSRPWKGTFNYLAIFDRNLSREEVQHNYTIGPYGLAELIPPSDLVATSIAVANVSLSWTDNSSNEDGFIIERGVGTPTIWGVLDTVSADITNYTDETVLEGIEYSYRCKIYNQFANISSNYSNTSSTISKIKTPSGLVAKSENLGKITLSWTDNSSAENGFYIERGEGNPIVFSKIDSVGENVTTYNDFTVEEGVEYSYRINSYNSIITSEYSNVISIRSKASFINKPTSLSVTIHDTLGIPVLSWIDNSFNESGFVIERRLVKLGTDFVTIDTVAENETTYTDGSVQDSSTYSYRVLAFNDEYKSEYSNEELVDVLVDIDWENKIINSFELYQNYPNPFNPTTNISFVIPENAKIKLKIFNLLGQELYTLVDNNFTKGQHNIKFDASALPSGIYIYTMNASAISGKEYVSSKKLILIK
ncbi:MAG: hypothetical protein CR986_06950 [Ignavibacteriae bacterium]|nr:MAG: hypothetical protein CR986_06950 [Ignavibacteriota bacterium]